MSLKAVNQSDLLQSLNTILQVNNDLSLEKTIQDKKLILGVRPDYISSNIQVAQPLLKATLPDNSISLSVDPVISDSLIQNQQILNLQANKYPRIGLISGGQVNLNGTDKIDVHLGSGFLYNDPLVDQVPTYVQWSDQLNLTVPFLQAEDQIIYVFINSSGQVVFSNFLYSRANFILLARLWLAYNTNEIVLLQHCPTYITTTTTDESLGLYSMNETLFGSSNTPTQTSLSFYGTSLYGLGINASNDPSFSPNLLTVNGQNPATFFLATSTTVLDRACQVLPDASLVDFNGTGALQPNPGGPFSATSYCVYILSTGDLFVQYGTQVSQNLSAEITRTFDALPLLHPWVRDHQAALLIGVISISRQWQSFNDYNEFHISYANRFGHLAHSHLYNYLVDRGSFQQIYGAKEFFGRENSWNEMITLSSNNQQWNASQIGFRGVEPNFSYNYANIYAQILNNQRNNEKASVGFNCAHEGSTQTFLQFYDGTTQLTGGTNGLMLQCFRKVDSVNQQLTEPYILAMRQNGGLVAPADYYQGIIDVSTATEFPTFNNFGISSIKQNYTWMAISTGTINTLDIQTGQILKALVDNPGQDPQNWTVENIVPFNNLSMFNEMSFNMNEFSRSVLSGQEPIPGIYLPTVVNNANIGQYAFTAENISVPSLASNFSVKLIEAPNAGTTINKLYSHLTIGSLLITPGGNLQVTDEIAFCVGPEFGSIAQNNFAFKDETDPQRMVQNKFNRMSLGPGAPNAVDNISLQMANDTAISTPSIILQPLTTLQIANLPARAGTLVFNSDLNRLQLDISGNNNWQSISFE